MTPQAAVVRKEEPSRKNGFGLYFICEIILQRRDQPDRAEAHADRERLQMRRRHHHAAHIDRELDQRPACGARSFW